MPALAGRRPWAKNNACLTLGVNVALPTVASLANFHVTVPACKACLADGPDAPNKPKAANQLFCNVKVCMMSKVLLIQSNDTQLRKPLGVPIKTKSMHILQRVKEMRHIYAISLTSIITASCGAAEMSSIQTGGDDINFHPPLYTTPAPKEITFSSCDESALDLRKLIAASSGESNKVSCSQKFPDSRLIARVGPTAHCEVNYCPTFLLDPPLADGTILGTALPDTKGSFPHVTASEAGSKNFYNLKAMEEIAPDSRSPKFGGVVETDWNYLVDFKGYGRQVVTVSPVGISRFGISTIEITPSE